MSRAKTHFETQALEDYARFSFTSPKTGTVLEFEVFARTNTSWHIQVTSKGVPRFFTTGTVRLDSEGAPRFRRETKLSEKHPYVLACIWIFANLEKMDSLMDKGLVSIAPSHAMVEEDRWAKRMTGRDPYDVARESCAMGREDMSQLLDRAARVIDEVRAMDARVWG